MLHVACPCWRCSAWYVVEAAAQPGFFSRAKSARHESWRGCGPRVRPRWSLLGCGCASPAAIVRLCSSQATKMLACEPVCCVFVVSRCVRDACRCVTELACRLGSGRPQVCVKRAPAQRVSLSRVGSALRPLLKSIYLCTYTVPQLRTPTCSMQNTIPETSACWCDGDRPTAPPLWRTRHTSHTMLRPTHQILFANDPGDCSIGHCNYRHQQPLFARHREAEGGARSSQYLVTMVPDSSCRSQVRDGRSEYTELAHNVV